MSSTETAYYDIVGKYENITNYCFLLCVFHHVLLISGANILGVHVGSHAANKKTGIQRMKSVVGTPYYIAPEVLKADSRRSLSRLFA